MNGNSKTRRRGRAQLILLAVIFLGPLALAFWLYYGTDGWRPVGSTNHGALVDPVVTLPETALTTVQGETTAPDVLRRHWIMLYVNRGPCDETCRQDITKIRQIRLALGAEADRVERVYLYGDSAPDVAWLAETQVGLVAAGLADNPALAAALPEGGPAIYFVDPHGNLMMRFATDAPPADIKDDLKKLLKVSRIG